MESIIILKTAFIFIVFWGLAVAFLLFRPRVSFLWKAAAIAIFLLYLWFFGEEIQDGYISFTENWYAACAVFAKKILFLMFYLLFVFWPVALVTIFYKADDRGAQNLLQFMVIFTVCVWILAGFYLFYTRGADGFLQEKIHQLLPFLP